MVRKNGRYSHRSLYKEECVEIEITFSDVMEYIEDYATLKEISIIFDFVSHDCSGAETQASDLDGDYIREEKAILLARAAKKFTLQELEQKLGGNKFDFI